MASQPAQSQFLPSQPISPRRLLIKIASALLILFGLSTVLAAQDAPPVQTPAPALSEDFRAQSLKRGAWELGVLAGGGSGLGKSDGTQFFYAGGRVGLVLTGDHLPGLLRGNFEWAVDILPLYPVFPPENGIYAASIKPAIWQWNFTSGKKIAPYVAAAGGVVFSKSNIPPGDTSQINFTPQLVVGSHVFFQQHRALFFEGSLGHLSSASIGNHNPGYNVTFLFTVGLSWFRGGR
jgi:lipid A 3-O-deacylase